MLIDSTQSFIFVLHKYLQRLRGFLMLYSLTLLCHVGIELRALSHPSTQALEVICFKCSSENEL